MKKPIRVQDLVGRRRTTTVELPEDIGNLEITYSPYDAAIEEQWMEIDVREGIGKIQKLALQIEIILISWDIEDADGERVKPTYDVLSKLDYQVINALFKGIIDDMLPPKAPVALSVAGS